VKLFGIPARYANATFTAASKQGVLDQVETELAAFKAVRIMRAVCCCALSYPIHAQAPARHPLARNGLECGLLPLWAGIRLARVLREGGGGGGYSYDFRLFRLLLCAKPAVLNV
jgi:hypothetical protein